MVTVLDVPGDGIGEVRAVIMAQYVKMNGRAVYNLKVSVRLVLCSVLAGKIELAVECMLTGIGWLCRWTVD